MSDETAELESYPGTERRRAPRSDPAEREHRDAIFGLARAAELQDVDTGNHVFRIRLIVERLARCMGVADAEALGYDAMLHDVGKLAISRDLLRKPGSLTVEERSVMESHTVFGERFLAARPTMKRAARIARSHHECWDGTGYPDGLREDMIPLEARITAVADILDALVGERCYKEAWSFRDAFEEVCQLAGTRLDPRVIEALRRCESEGGLRDIFRPSAYDAPPPGR